MQYLNRLNIGVVNFNSVWGDKRANVRKMEKFIKQASLNGCEFLVFPELCVNGYADDKLENGKRIHLELAEDAIGETSNYIRMLAKRHNMYIVYGMSEKIQDDGCHAYNTAIVATNCGEMEVFRKFHPVEGNWCKAYDGEPKLLNTIWGKFAISICYDTYAVPELIRYYVSKGARLIVNPTASSRGIDAKIGETKGWEWYYRRRLETICDREGVFVASANMYGKDGLQKEDGSYPYIFPGKSVVIAPIGEKEKFVSYPIKGENYEGVFCKTIDLSYNRKECLMRSELYSKWYSQLANNPPKIEIPLYSIVKIAVSNFQTCWGDKEANLKLMSKQAQQAAEQDADIVVFPEMALTGYSYIPTSFGEKCMQHSCAEPIPGNSTAFMASIAKRYGIYIVYGMPEIFEKNIYNSAAIITPEGNTYSYRKIHPVSNETRWCKSGTQPFILETKWGKIAVSICYDTYFIPEITRYYAANGVRLLISPSASTKGYEQGRWQWYYQSRLEVTADREGMVIASANLCGSDGSSMVSFPGGSVVVGATWTKPIYYAGEVCNCTPGMIVSEQIDLSKSEFKAHGFKPEFYSKLYNSL